MEFLVEFELHIPEGTPESEVKERVDAEAGASARLGRAGNLVRLWRPPAAPGERKAIGLYRAETEEQLKHILGELPLSQWMHATITPLQPHPNDPTSAVSQLGPSEFHNAKARLLAVTDPHLEPSRATGR